MDSKFVYDHISEWNTKDISIKLKDWILSLQNNLIPIITIQQRLDEDLQPLSQRGCMKGKGQVQAELW